MTKKNLGVERILCLPKTFTKNISSFPCDFQGQFEPNFIALSLYCVKVNIDNCKYIT